MKDEAAKAVVFNQSGKQAILPHNMSLPNDFLQADGSHTHSEWPIGHGRRAIFGLLEEAGLSGYIIHR